MSPEDRKLLIGLDKSAFGRVLRDYLNGELKKIDTVKGVKTIEEALGREKAVDIVVKLFSFMSGVPDKVDKKPTKYS